ncbi:2-hydroxymuconic semialdehyde dehydrogenase [Pluralibacter gergoviae]|nr:2-hydroxymuconic semialdehyde dehydrogenase [Pluralibacter gergoviae]ELW9441137.1 2-hydroxymuconic semialdehyde dehydrogenase [Pluralibacter gergoviae]
MKMFKNYINGQWVTTAKQFEDRNPVDNTLVGMVYEAGKAEVDAAVKAARAALGGPWGKMTQQQRCNMLVAVADEIHRRFDDFLAAEIADTGKPKGLASRVDIPRGGENFRDLADLSMRFPTESYTFDTPDGGKAINYGVRTPRGVIAVISPWNLPLLLMTWKVGPALACGNTVVVKPSEVTPATATLLAEVMETVGLPPGVFNLVHGFGPDSAGAYLTEHPDVDGITFTGETRTGEAIMKAAAKGVRPVSFELGGKNAGLVFADCDFDKAVAGITRSAFENTGQVCLGTERVYVERPIFDRFVAALKKSAESLRPGNPWDEGVNFGPLVSQEHYSKVLSYYEKAKADGATVVTGGERWQLPGALAEGAWIKPTIWTGLPETSAVIREEIFGPCVHLAPFDTEEEAIALANNTPYGLACTAWTTDVSRAHRLGSAIEVGIFWINSWFLRDLRTSFGGAKQSGIGREGGSHTYEFYTETRNICVKL